MFIYWMWTFIFCLNFHWYNDSEIFFYLYRHSAQFYARADNLNYWLATVESRLGSLSQRLSASVGQRRLNTDLAGDSAAVKSTDTPEEIEIKTPWLEVDDVFYEARGSAWALIHILRAVEIDFAEVLEKKNAGVSMQQIVRELEATQEAVFSPVILNGSGFGVLANHSLVMASYISRANAAIINLRELLAQGWCFVYLFSSTKKAPSAPFLCLAGKNLDVAHVFADNL